MDIENQIRLGLTAAFSNLFDVDLPHDRISLQPTNQEFEGTHTFVVFPFLKLTKKSPEESAKVLGDYLVENVKIVRSYNAVKGFLNLEVSDASWLDLFRHNIMTEQFGIFPSNGKKVMVEYSSPNTNKPLHLGHLRNNFLGYAVAEILKAAGNEVVKVNLINDRGIHICKSMLAYQKFGEGETPHSSGLKGDHLIGKYYVKYDQEYKRQVSDLIASGVDEEKAKKDAPVLKEAQELLKKWEDGDTSTVELWKKLNGWVYEGFEDTYRMIGVDFDKYYYESDTYLLGKDVVEEGLSKNVFYSKDDNSVWIDLSDEGLDQKLVLRGDGTSVYITQDLGTADLKYSDFGTERSIYVVGNEQDYHFKVLQAILKKLGRPYADGVYHLSYGMVDLPSGRMKSREGTVVDADDLIREMIDTAEQQTRELGKIENFDEAQLRTLYRMLGLGALKFFLLKVDPKKRMLFNPQESIEFQGNTGPFVQYTHARISAIIRRAKQLAIDSSSDAFASLEALHRSERDVIQVLNDFPKKIKEAADAYAPSLIAQYAFDLAKEYNRFYAEVSIFNEDDIQALAFRIALSDAVAKTLSRSMRLLGIDVPERM